MTTCPHCRFSFAGLAAHCPRCERALPPTSRISPPRPLTKRQKATVGSVAAAVGLAASFVLFFLGIGMFFCMDLDLFGDDGVNSCAAEQRAGALYLWFVLIPVSILVAVGTGYSLVRWMLRRNRRSPPPPWPAQG